MNYPCGLIQDLLPLFHDGVCSEESKSVIKEHLKECEPCKKYYEELCEADCMDQASSPPPDPTEELKKAASFQAVKKKLHRRLILAVVIAALVTSGIFWGISVLHGSTHVVQWDENISVSEMDGSLVGRIFGTRAQSMRIKRVEFMEEGRTKTRLFFSMASTRWDDLITGDDEFSENVLCYGDKGADQIDEVYYYAACNAEFDQLEMMGSEELEKVMDEAVLLWNRE